MGDRLLPGAQDRLAPGRSVAQLAALARLGELLTRARIDYWLFGGWAVDFYAGAVTRPHDDIDFAVRLADRDHIAALLEAAGWTHAPEPDEEGGTGYEREGERLELTFIECFEWSAHALGTDVAELEGVSARLISLGALKRGKASPRPEPDDAAKDRADASVLAGL